jgi:hypothetical protein
MYSLKDLADKELVYLHALACAACARYMDGVPTLHAIAYAHHKTPASFVFFLFIPECLAAKMSVF